MWAPVATKILGLALALLVLSGVGLASISRGPAGVRVPLADMLGVGLHGAWLSEPSAAAANGANPKTGPISPGVPALNVSQGSASAETQTPVPKATSADPTSGAADAAIAAPGMTADGKVILNLASAADLRHLPGVGSKRADAIVALRVRLGHFKHVNDLLRVKGIGVRGLKKLLPHVVLDAPQTPNGASASGTATGHA